MTDCPSSSDLRLFGGLCFCGPSLWLCLCPYLLCCRELCPCIRFHGLWPCPVRGRLFRGPCLCNGPSRIPCLCPLGPCCAHAACSRSSRTWCKSKDGRDHVTLMTNFVPLYIIELCSDQAESARL